MKEYKRDKSIKKSASGITLIALIITIIVLIVLAGVTISFIVGDNGILNQAEDATEDTQEATAKEELELAILAAEAERYDKLDTGTVPNRSEYLTEENLNKLLGGKGTVKIESTKPDGTIKATYTDSKDNEKYKFEIDTSGKVTLDILANKITVENYGDKVNYTTNPANIANAVTNVYAVSSLDGVATASETAMEWRIFYTEGEYVFLIASDYLPHSMINKEKTGIIPYKNETGYTCPIKWSDNVEWQTMTQQRLFKATGYTLKSKFQNSRWTSTLLNTSNWTQFVDSSKASYAIGSPTLEMWIASWNEKYNDNLAFGISTAGYKVGINTLGDSIDEGTMKTKPGYQVPEADNMYYPHKGAFGGAWGYFLASPGANNSNSMVRVDAGGMLGHNAYADYCLRPVVCLKKSTTGEKNAESGIWELE